MSESIHLTIDGKEIAVPKGTTVYQACQQLGIHIPIFCYQDRMPPFGACRVCLVEVEKAPKLQTSCTLEAAEGMVVHTQTERALEGRKGIIELLLINHPLDCPICDKGGECPLQDQALEDGPGKSRFHDEKRHFKKPISLGPVLTLDRERCIMCARCTRFCDLVSGDHALQLIDRGFKSEVGTPGNQPIASKYIGNTIEICPVGALTSSVYRFRARPWDNTHTPSTCMLCPVGCSLTLDERDGDIVRTRSCENGEINDIWLCDKGWFGYEFISHPKRLLRPLIRKYGHLEESTWDEALSLIAAKIDDFKGRDKIAGFGGNPLTTEENSLFQQLMRKGCGVSHVDHRIGMAIFSPEEEGSLPGMESSIEECNGHIYLLGVDLTEEFPLLWLRLKQAKKITFIGHYAPEISADIHEVILHAPGEEIETLKKHPFDPDGVLLIGSQYLRSKNRKAILSQLRPFSLNLLEGRGNSLGARLAGMHPGKEGLDALKVLEKAAIEGWDLLYIAGANPAKKFPSKLWRQARMKTAFVVVHDLFLTETAEEADVVLPALSFLEKEGTMVTIQRKIQQLRPGQKGPLGAKGDGEIFRALAKKLKIELGEAATELKFPQPLFADTPIHNAHGTLRATFVHLLFDEGVRMLHNRHLSQLAKKPSIRLHPLMGFHTGDKVRINGHLTATVKIDDRVAEGTVVIPLGFKELPSHELGANLMNGMPITLERVG